MSSLVRADKLELLYRQSFMAIFVSIFVAALITAILWPVQNHRVLLVWFGILFVTAAARFILFTRYRKIAPQGLSVLSWEKPYFVTLFLSSLTWGVGGVFIMPLDSQVHQAVIFSFLVGLSGGAISLYSSHRAITLTTIAVILLPATGYFLLFGGYIFAGMAAGAIIFFISAIRATGYISETLNQNFLMRRQLEASKKNAERLANIDDLTGLYNRRAFYEIGKVLTNNNQRSNDEISMIIMDIDNFKSINDNYGHAAGDAALKQVGKFLLQRLRKSDIFARIGGEEFAMILPKTSLKQSVKIAEGLRRVIEEVPITTENKSFTITASFGVTSGAYDIETLARQADKAMYQSKDSGRNAVKCYEF